MKKYYLTKKRLHKIFKPSKEIEAKKVVLFNSLDNVKKMSKTPNDIIHNLIKWSFSYNGVFANSKHVVSRYISGNNSKITLANGNHVSHLNKKYLLFKNSRAVLSLANYSHDYGDALTAINNAIKAMETGKWYFKQNPRTSFGKYATPITMNQANAIISDVKKSVDNILYVNDKGRIKRINDFERLQITSAKN